MDNLLVALSNSLMLLPVFCAWKSLKKIIALSVFMSYQKYLEAHQIFIPLSQLTHELAVFTTLEYKTFTNFDRRSFISELHYGG